MSSILSFAQTKKSGTESSSIDMASLMTELDHFRKKNARLLHLNELHARLAASIDLASMIEGFSVWLMPRVAHDLVAYNNLDKERSYIYCSCHGPDREKVVDVAEKIFQLQPNNISNRGDDEYYVQNWHLESWKPVGYFLYLRKIRY